jgi:hypothetical protein
VPAVSRAHARLVEPSAHVMAEGALRRAAWRALLEQEGWRVVGDEPSVGHPTAVLVDATSPEHVWIGDVLARLAEHERRHAGRRIVAVIPTDLPADHLVLHALATAGVSTVVGDGASPAVLDAAMRGHDPGRHPSWPPAPPPALTATERRVATVLAGRPDSRHAMALDLGIAVSTLDVHVQSIKGVVRELLTLRGELGQDGALTTERLGAWLRERGFGRFPPAGP